MIDETGCAIRVHAYEFGDPIDGREPDTSSRFLHLRATEHFPPSAAWHARLGPIEIRRADLWRLLDPATAGGAIVVWPTSPAQAHEALDGGCAPGDFDTRVISLVRVSHPNTRSARGRASLNVRSIVFAEQDWQQHAGDLAVLAPGLLRGEFDALFASGSCARPYFGNGARPAGDTTSMCTAALADGIARREPMSLGSETAETEAAFWTLAGDALALLPHETRQQVSLASGFAAQFAVGTICHRPAERTLPTRPDRDLPASAISAPCAAFGRLTDATETSRASSAIDTLHSALCGEHGAAEDLIGEIFRHFGRAAGEIACQLRAIGRDETPSEPSGLKRLGELAEIAQRIPAGRAAGAWRTQILRQCEDGLVAHFAANGLVLPEQLHDIQGSRALVVLVRRLIERRPHAIVAHLQRSFVILANSGPGGPTRVDECLRHLLPPRWSAAQWLALFEATWAIRQALHVLRNAKQLPRDVADLEHALLNRLSCAALPGKRAACVRAPDRPAGRRIGWHSAPPDHPVVSQFDCGRESYLC